MIELKEKYGCDRITIQSGGTVNGMSLREKLFDYVNIVVAPVLIGGKETSTLIDGKSIISDAFYKKCNESELYRNMGALAVEMETPALYMNAAEAKKNALTILTCSDHLFKTEELTAKERETGFTDMMEIALKTAIQL